MASGYGRTNNDGSQNEEGQSNTKRTVKDLSAKCTHFSEFIENTICRKCGMIFCENSIDELSETVKHDFDKNSKTQNIYVKIENEFAENKKSADFKAPNCLIGKDFSKTHSVVSSKNLIESENSEFIENLETKNKNNETNRKPKKFQHKSDSMSGKEFNSLENDKKDLDIQNNNLSNTMQENVFGSFRNLTKSPLVENHSPKQWQYHARLEPSEFDGIHSQSAREMTFSELSKKHPVLNKKSQKKISRISTVPISNFNLHSDLSKEEGSYLAFQRTNSKKTPSSRTSDFQSRYSANMVSEIITIYRKMKKGKNQPNIYRALLNVDDNFESNKENYYFDNSPQNYTRHIEKNRSRHNARQTEKSVQNDDHYCQNDETINKIRMALRKENSNAIETAQSTKNSAFNKKNSNYLSEETKNIYGIERNSSGDHSRFLNQNRDFDYCESYLIKNKSKLEPSKEIAIEINNYGNVDHFDSVINEKTEFVDTFQQKETITALSSKLGQPIEKPISISENITNLNQNFSEKSLQSSSSDHGKNNSGPTITNPAMNQIISDSNINSNCVGSKISESQIRREHSRISNESFHIQNTFQKEKQLQNYNRRSENTAFNSDKIVCDRNFCIKKGIPSGEEIKSNNEKDFLCSDSTCESILDGNSDLSSSSKKQNKFSSSDSVYGEKIPTSCANLKIKKTYDFAKYNHIQKSKYLFYSPKSNLFQTNLFSEFAHFISQTSLKYAWINIFDPNEQDLQLLAAKFNVHDITLSDIRERNTEEKLDIFNNYYFLSIKLFNDQRATHKQDIDFNIMLFKTLAITTHDKNWVGINDMVNFLSLLSAHTTIYPDWILFSVMIEFLQDLKCLKEEINHQIDSLREKSLETNSTMVDILKIKFTIDVKILNLKNLIKAKLRILISLRKKLGLRVKNNVLKLLGDIKRDYKEQIIEINEMEKILLRIQDLGFALVNMYQTQEANKMNKQMKWLTMIQFVFLPCQTVSGLWGMNVKVPGQNESGLKWFWILLLVGPFISLLYLVTKSVYRKKRKNISKKNI